MKFTRFAKITNVAGVMALCALPSFGWSQKGHDTVAFIAENHLTPATKAAVDSLLDGKSIVYWSNWLDNASHTPEYAYSKTWHYKNIDADQTFRSAPLLPSGDIVRAINEQVAVLADTNIDDSRRALALKIVTHLLGDIHQPMHLGHASDRGGNSWTVKYFKQPTNLHSLWDSRLVESGHKWSYTEWQQQIDRATPAEVEVILTDAYPEHWAEETYEICKKVYETTPQDTNVSYDYIAQWTPTVEQQFLRGGLRLADILNTVFDPDYKGHWSPLKK